MIATATQSVYNIKIDSLQGDPIDLGRFKDKKILIINVASKCGFTSQYRDLQALQDKYIESLVIIGVPCNQFGEQEPGSASDIQEFCKVNYGVSFLMTEKINVKGAHKHPLYTWLTEKSLNGKQTTTIKWNFQKYLIDENGNFLDYFYSITNPSSSRLLKYLK